MNAYYTTLEMVDAYGTLVLAFLFLSAVVYYRNTLFRVFFYLFIILLNNLSINSFYITLGLYISTIFKYFKTNFKGRK